MKYVLVVLAFLSFNVLAFKPEDLNGAEIKAVAPCREFACAVAEKDGKQYIIMGELTGEEELNPLAIYVVEGKKLHLIWSITWIDT